MGKQTNKAYVLLSGGQDSFVCLIWALANFKVVETVSIAYGQRHIKEIEHAKQIAKHFAVKHTVYDIGLFLKSIADSSLLHEGSHDNQHELASNLPASFVPNRNGLFLTIISNHAFKNNEDRIEIVIGTCETDYSGYPDCRDVYIKSKEVELSLGLEKPVTIHTPLMWKTKSQTFEMAHEAGKLDELNDLTLTCYNGNESQNAWGKGCGECPSCKLRKKGFEEFSLTITKK